MRAQSPAIAGRTALVSGSGSGLGKSIAIALAEAGARLILVGRTEPTLTASAETIRALGGSVRVEVADTSSADEVEGLAVRCRDEVVSILINNAGIAGPVAPLIDISPAEWDAVFDVNVRGVFLMCRAFLPPMIQRREGDIINMASVSGKRPLPRRTPYVSSKTALLALTSTLAHEVGEFGVVVNTLSPGPVSSDRMERNLRLEAEATGRTVDECFSSLVSQSALGRMVHPDEVSAAVVAMLQMPGMTGADVDLSAGMVAR